MDPSVARGIRLAVPSIIEVISVTDPGPAARAGIRPGDWLLARDGRVLSSVDELVEQRTHDRIGPEIELVLLRGTPRTTLGVAPEGDLPECARPGR